MSSRWQKQAEEVGRTRVAETEAIRRASKGKQATVRLDRLDELLEETADILLDGHLLVRGQQLYHKVEQTLGELVEEHESESEQ